MAATCNICGSTRFLLGPGGRRSLLGFAPLCESCGSLERHRTLRRAYEKLETVLPFKQMDLLQFSDDQSIPRSSFKSFAISVYGGENSQDIQDIKLADASVDLVVCNHVLEHVPDDKRALRELARLMRTGGALQIGVPDPVRRATTEDWGYPKKEDHGHYRLYGIDFLAKLREALPEYYLAYFRLSDPVTFSEDIYFFITQTVDVAEKIRSAFPGGVVEKMGQGIVQTPWSAPLPSLTSIVDSAAHMPQSSCRRYIVERGYAAVEGWLLDGALTTTSVLARLQDAAGVRGVACEIGVHHGRFFIALALLAGPDCPALAIDVFENQIANVDKSGLGDREKFLANSSHWLGADREVKILAGDSMALTSADVLAQLSGQRVRLFSVDGGHTSRHLLNDVKIAESVLCEGGIVIVDDFYNPHWPGVNEGVYQYLLNPGPDALVPFCYGDNKLYLCHPNFAPLYSSAIVDGLIPFSIEHKLVEMCGKRACQLRMPSLADVGNVMSRSTADRADAKVTLCGLPISQLLGSWQAAEPRGRWTGAELSGVIVPLPKSETHWKLKGQISGMVRPHQKTGAKLSVFVDGEIRFQSTVRRTGELANFIIDLEHGKGSIRLEFSTDCAVTANEVLQTSDNRMLGVHVSSLALLL